ncbi:NAD-binding protein [Actinokineospora sp.]|uniref:NAD-binding protein n=1 Tax=Actinokineospora sp. TaxID=1872133 RepID=UPI003D6C2132
MSPRTGSAVVLGDTEVARRTCAALGERGYVVTHLIEPSDADLRAALRADVAAVAVLIHGDITALRYALLVEHLSPGIRLVVTLFDRTVAGELLRVVPNCQITSPADVSVPSIIGACLGAPVLAVDPAGVMLVDTGDGVTTRRWRTAEPWHRRASRTLAAQARAHDVTSRMLRTGGVGLLATLVAEWLLATLVFGLPATDALHLATRITAGVGPTHDGHAPAWYPVVSSAGMVLTIGFTALFTAGLVHRSLSTRSVGMVGPRTMPTSDHVVVVGLGQVGLRLAMALRGLSIPVLVVERDPAAANLRLAKAAGIPVLIAHAQDRAVLDRLRLGRARALAAMSAHDLDNVEVAIAALATAPDLRVVLRAGDDDVIAETRSLFPIGDICDVSSLTTHAVAAGVDGRSPRFVYAHDRRIIEHPAPDHTPAPSSGPESIERCPHWQ